MFRKLTFLAMTFILSIQQIVAGAGNSTISDEQENQTQRRRGTSHWTNTEEDLIKGAAILTGVAAVAGAAFGLYQIFKDTGTPETAPQTHSRINNVIPLIDLRKSDDIGVIYDYFRNKIKAQQKLYEETMDNKGMESLHVVFRNYQGYNGQELVSQWLQEGFFQKRIENFQFKKEGLLSVCLRKYKIDYQKSQNDIQKADIEYLYLNENFEIDAWKKEKGLPNYFPSKNCENTRNHSVYRSNNHIEESLNCESHSNDNSSETDEGSEGAPLTSFKNCPAIDLSFYGKGNNIDGITEGRIPAIDLHPVYNQNFSRHLRNEIFKIQKAYHLSQIKEKKVYIITGTGRKRPGLNHTLQNSVNELLKTDYFSRRIAFYRLEKEGLFAVFLRKNIREART